MSKKPNLTQFTFQPSYRHESRPQTRLTQRNLRRPSCLTVSRDTSIKYYKESRKRIFSLWDTRWYACETPVIQWWELCVRHERHLDMGSLINVSVHIVIVVSYQMSRFDQRLRVCFYWPQESWLFPWNAFSAWTYFHELQPSFENAIVKSRNRP